MSKGPDSRNIFDPSYVQFSVIKHFSSFVSMETYNVYC